MQMAAASEGCHQRVLMDGLFTMYRDRMLTDVILEAEQEEIHCHRNVLAAASPYFRAMFTSPVKERDEQKIRLHSIGSNILKAVIGYIYTGHIVVTNENVQDLIVSANMFELEHLIGRCADYMIDEICVSNCIEMLQFASHFACQKLRQSARAFILDHFLEVILDNDKIISLSIDEFEDIISSDDLGVDTEETVYNIIVKWSQEDKRDTYFPRLFEHVRLPLINETFYNDLIANNSLLHMDSKCQRLLDLYKLYRDQTTSETKGHVSDTITNSDDKSSDVKLNDTPRHGMHNKTMLVFSSGAFGENERSLTAFDPNTLKNYLALQPHPTFDFKFKVDYFQLVTTWDNDILFIGGIFYDNHHFEDHGAPLKDVFMYNTRQAKWEKKASMDTGRCCFSAAAYHNSVYVIGGKPTYPRGEPTDAVEMYNIDADRWTPVSSLLIKLYAHASCVAKDAIFVFGGKDEDDDFLDTVFRYDIASDSWALVTTQLPKPRAMHSSFYFNGNMYIVGGTAMHQNILTVSIYHPERNRWTHGADFPEERKITAAGFHKGTIYVCGGLRHLGVTGRRTRQVESRDLYKYDIAKGTWTKVVKLVQYGNTQSTTVAVLNTKYLRESDFVSTL